MTSTFRRRREHVSKRLFVLFFLALFFCWFYIKTLAILSLTHFFLFALFCPFFLITSDAIFVSKKKYLDRQCRSCIDTRTYLSLFLFVFPAGAWLALWVFVFCTMKTSALISRIVFHSHGFYSRHVHFFFCKWVLSSLTGFLTAHAVGRKSGPFLLFLLASSNNRNTHVVQANLYCFLTQIPTWLSSGGFNW